MKQTNKTILVTGANGFLGRHMWMYLQKHCSDYDLYGVDLTAGKDCNVVVCDIKDKKKFVKLLKNIKPQYIFHLAGGRSSSDTELLETNYVATKALFDVLSELQKKDMRVVVPGSAAEYGPSMGRFLQDETQPLNPMNVYGLIKSMQTSLCRMYARDGFNVVVARIFNISGPGVPETFGVGKFAKQISLIEKNKKKTLQTKGLDDQRDFLDIEDVCSALWAVAQKGKKGEIYNVCSGKSYTMRFIVQEMMAQASFDDIPLKETKDSVAQGFHSRGSNKKLIQDTSWKLRVGLKKSLNRTLQYYRSEC